MAKIVIGAERLPTLEILGTEYPYDASKQSTLDRLAELGKNMDPTLDAAVAACKEFVTMLFCDNHEPTERIGEVYKDSAVLWIDVVMQLSQFVGPDQAMKGMLDRINRLKAAAGKK